MPFNIQYFNPKVRSHIESWPTGIYAGFSRVVEQIAEFGPDLGMPYTKAMGDGLFEIRARGAEGVGRAFYCYLVGQRVIILHGFIKKTQATPEKELAIARKRQKEIRHA